MLKFTVLSLLSVAYGLSLPDVHTRANGPGYLSAPVKNCDRYYCMVNVSVGIPEPGTPQYSFDFVADTGSGELWVAADTSGTGNIFNINNTVGGTSNIVNNSFTIAYTDGVSQNGYWMNQPVTIAGVQMNTLLGGANSTGGGMMGLGPVAQQNATGGGPLSNVLQAMIDSNTTATPAFSLYLDPTVGLYSGEQGNAEVLFGGIDSTRFEPPLMMLQSTPFVSEYHVYMDSIVTSDGSVIRNSQIQVLLDSGMPLLVLPSAEAQAMAAAYNATSIPGTVGVQTYGYTCDWNVINTLAEVSLYFTFGTQQIQVPMSSLAINPYNNGTCYLAIANYGDVDPGAILGNPFLRNTYTVFDAANHQIAMAQAKPAEATRNIKAITNGTFPFVQQDQVVTMAMTSTTAAAQTATANNDAAAITATTSTPAKSGSEPARLVPGILAIGLLCLSISFFAC